MHLDYKSHDFSIINCAVLTVSDTRTKETDKSGKVMMERLEAAGHRITQYQIITDDRQLIHDTVYDLSKVEQVQAILVNGGTGISNRDVTIEALQPLFSKEIPGFGELFRMLSYQLDIGSASMLSRAIAGVVNHRVVFSTPGSSKAVELAMDKLIIPELGHTVREVRKDL